MRRMLTLLVVVAIGLAVLYVIAPTLPEGNPLRLAGEGLRSIGESIARGFGGGYGELPQGG